jgi:hypothetical protein
LDGIDAAYEFAGAVGVRPEGLTLRQLFRMHNGLARQRRVEILQSVLLEYGERIDAEKFLATGEMKESNIGKPLELSPELEAKVQEEIDRIRQENPNLPRFATVEN